MKLKVALSPLEARVFMQDQYEMRTGIFDHVNGAKDRPLSSVAMFPCEDYASNGRTYDLYYKFANGNYREIWGISVEQYLALPQWKTRMMDEITDKITKGKSVELDAQLAKLKNEK